MDCKTILFVLALVVIWLMYRFVDRYFNWLMAGGMLIMRGLFVVTILLTVAGTPGLPEELLFGAAWAALEVFVGQIKKRRTDDDEEVVEEEDE